jgi:hypothetical protein
MKTLIVATVVTLLAGCTGMGGHHDGASSGSSADGSYSSAAARYTDDQRTFHSFSPVATGTGDVTSTLVD